MTTIKEIQNIIIQCIDSNGVPVIVSYNVKDDGKINIDVEKKYEDSKLRFYDKTVTLKFKAEDCFIMNGTVRIDFS